MGQEVTPEQKALIAKAVTLDEAEIYDQIGQLLYVGAMPAKIGELVALGHSWAKERWHDFRDIVCSHRSYIDDAGDIVEKVVKIVTLLDPGTAPGAAGALFAVLIAKIGVTMACDKGIPYESAR